MSCWLRLLTLSECECECECEPEAARELADLCGKLPLALRVAGNRLALLQHWTIASFAAQLRDEQTRLTALSAGDLQVRPAFEVSYHRLSTAARHMFRRLALVPGADFGIELAAIVAGADLAAARRPLDDLVDATLVQPSAKPGRYQFHDLIRIFSKERLEAEESPADYGPDADAVNQYLLRAATDAGRLFIPDTGPGTSATASAELREGPGPPEARPRHR